MKYEKKRKNIADPFFISHFFQEKCDKVNLGSEHQNEPRKYWNFYKYEIQFNL